MPNLTPTRGQIILEKNACEFFALDRLDHRFNMQGVNALYARKQKEHAGKE